MHGLTSLISVSAAQSPSTSFQASEMVPRQSLFQHQTLARNIPEIFSAFEGHYCHKGSRLISFVHGATIGD